MFLEQYNFLMGSMLNQQYALAKLRGKIEGREERVCWGCRKFGHLACNCRNKKEEEKGKPIPQNRFEVIASRVMQYGVRGEVKVRKQKIVEEGVQCFRCQRMGHYKWECPNIKKEKKKRSKEVAYTVSLQKVQQEERLVCSLWRKVQEHSGTWGMPLRSATLEQKG